jgi:hypothetical protein
MIGEEGNSLIPLFAIVATSSYEANAAVNSKGEMDCG